MTDEVKAGRWRLRVASFTDEDDELLRELGVALERIKDGTITDYVYDPKTVALVRSGAVMK